MSKFSTNQIRQSLLTSLYSLEVSKKIESISGREFLKGLNATTILIKSNKDNRKFRSVNHPNLASLIGKRVRLCGTLVSCGSETCYIQDTKEKESRQSYPVNYISSSLECDGHEIQCVPVTHKHLKDKVQMLKDIRVAVTGTIIQIPISSRKTKPCLFIDQIEESTSLLDKINPSKHIVTEAEAYIEKNKSRLLECLTDDLTKYLGIVTEISDDITAGDLPGIALIIAACTPYLEGKNGMCHVQIFGLPASGKSFLLSSLKILLAYFAEVAGGRLTVAGFTASTERDSRTGQIGTRKGALANAHKGAIYIQDLHSMRKEPFEQITHILSDQMEFGKVLISTSANTSYPAATAIVSDMNLKSEINKKEKFSIHEDLKWESQMLSRFDIMLSVRQIEMNKSSVRSLTKKIITDSKESSDRDIFFKVVIALLHEKVPDVDLGGVSSLIAKQLNTFITSNRDIMTDSLEFNASLGRTFKSIKKIVTAHARLHLRSVANAEDVAYAMKIVSLKFTVLKRIEPKIRASTLKLSTEDIRRQWIIENYAGKTESLTTLHKAFNKSFSESTVEERTIRRILEKIATPAGKGKWIIPALKNTKSVKNDKIDTNKLTKPMEGKP